MHHRRSEPNAQARHDREGARILAGRQQVGGVADGLAPGDADIGRELAPDLVAQTQADFVVRDTGAEIELCDILRLCGNLEARLQDQTLGQELVVLDLEIARDVAVLADVEVGLDAGPVGVEPLEAQDGVGQLRLRFEIVAQADLDVPVRRDGAVVEDLHLGGVKSLVERAFSFQLEPETVVVPADEAEPVVKETGLALAGLPFQPVEDGKPNGLIVVDRLARNVEPARGQFRRRDRSERIADLGEPIGNDDIGWVLGCEGSGDDGKRDAGNGRDDERFHWLTASLSETFTTRNMPEWKW